MEGINMNGLLLQVVFLIISYILGSIPWALIIGKLVKGIDIREHGSKNMGATNAFRVLGFKWGLLVFGLDAIKGGIILWIMKHNFFNFDYESFSFIIHPLAYGAFAFLGHLFPIFTKFKGGKGMSTASGIVLFYNPYIFIVGFITFFVIVTLTRFVSLASCLTVLSTLIAEIISPYKDIYLIVILAIISVFLIIKHIPNFKRIIKHTESKINFKSFSDPNEPAFIVEENKK
jgi:glycerol-3-phosphate acyltransferase PlsY